MSGIRLRRPTEADFGGVLALLQASDEAVYGSTDWTPSELRDQWEEIDLATDAWIAELDGRLAGVMHLADVRGGRMIADGYVHPALAGRGVGSGRHHAGEERARELEAGVPAGERVWLETAHLVGDDRAPRLLSCKGFTRVRTFFRMVADLTAEPAPPAWPAGIEVSRFEVDADGGVVHAAVEEAFVDEWGRTPRAYAEWAERCFGWRGFDPGLVVVARDGDEVAGVALNYPKRMGDWGWIGTVAVRPAWRRRGLGLALLRESFRRFREAGERSVALGVDAENPTGATRLYERAGMRVLWRADVWRKELRDA
jgi:ribosomal protein S18 acetylase RimI-like enzyme